MIHGQDVRGVYGDLLQFLPLESESQKYQWRVTNNASQEILEGEVLTKDQVITSQTLSQRIQLGRSFQLMCTGGFAKGIFPDIKEYSACVIWSSPSTSLTRRVQPHSGPIGLIWSV